MVDFKSYKKEVESLFLKNNIECNEVNILFCEFFNCSRAELLSKSQITMCQKTRLNLLIKRRLKGCPIQKLFKRAYFFDYTFFINNNVLCPRPETEILVEECINYINKLSAAEEYEHDKIVKVLDLCTGSGCIAITIKNKTSSQVFASDISNKAIKVAKKNAGNLNADVCFIKSDMFKNIAERFDVIVSNPPYIPSDDCDNLNIEVKKYDPKLALDGGEDGLSFYRIIACESKNYLNKNGKIFLEVGIYEAESVKNLLVENGFDCYIKKDYNNIERIVVGELKWLKNATKLKREFKR